MKRARDLYIVKMTGMKGIGRVDIKAELTFSMMIDMLELLRGKSCVIKELKKRGGAKEG